MTPLIFFTVWIHLPDTHTGFIFAGANKSKFWCSFLILPGFYLWSHDLYILQQGHGCFCRMSQILGYFKTRVCCVCLSSVCFWLFYIFSHFSITEVKSFTFCSICGYNTSRCALYDLIVQCLCFMVKQLWHIVFGGIFWAVSFFQQPSKFPIIGLFIKYCMRSDGLTFQFLVLGQEDSADNRGTFWWRFKMSFMVEI